ncbi:hypothetical protein F383_26693 [Gossypium arboreum]|uniref:Uncharacterized protein n=1 Tax=Gossypium arboreum TaxID=29729 RepID=A0A0B0PDA2_GOSAR|nr:hypothetical protein F383_26693 [Gossypium arboreum]
MDLRWKSIWPGISHTGMSHGRVPLPRLKHDLHGYTTRSCLFNSLDHRRATRACPCRAQV